MSSRSNSRVGAECLVRSVDVAADQAMQLRIECVLLSGDVATQTAMQKGKGIDRKRKEKKGKIAKE